MRTVTDGFANDTTANVVAFLSKGFEFYMADIYLIGEQEDSDGVYLTNWESPLLYSWLGTFQPANVERGDIPSKIGLDVSSIDFVWHSPNVNFAQNVIGLSPYQLVQTGFFDNKSFRAWTVYMPTPGDADTFGASELFGGRIASATVTRGSIQFKINSFLDIVNQFVPSAVIELLNTLACSKGATPPAGLTAVPYFVTDNVGGQTITSVIGTCTAPTPGQLFGTNLFQLGYLVFTGGSLKGVWSPVASNKVVNVAAANRNKFYLYSALPWSPQPGDTFYVSAAFPINQADGDYFGFPYVPAPESAI